MDIFGIGIDVVEVTRITAAIDRLGPAFLDRLFTPAERDYCESQATPALHYAARFAAKEAAAKALGTGIGGQAAWHDLQVVSTPSGAPQMLLSGAAAAFAIDHNITAIKISLTHAQAYAAANAIALTDSSR